MNKIFEGSILTEEDLYKYLIKLYFNLKEGDLEACVRRAYLDICRTLHRIRKHQGKEELFAKAKKKVIEILSSIKNSKFKNQKEFDEYHEKASKELRDLYHNNGFKGFYIGHSQKWINMALKYIFTMKEKRIPGYKHIYQYSHVPIDNIIKKKLKQYNFKSFNKSPWSRIKTYQEYFKIQQEIRKKFPKYLPMDVEFKLWNGEILD